MLESIEISGLLSFAQAKLDLKPLNVIIGPNGAGKSNLIEVINLLKATANDISKAIRQGGVISEWIWKGDEGKPGEISVVVRPSPEKMAFNYFLALDLSEQQLSIKSESLKTHEYLEVYVDIHDGKGSLCAVPIDDMERLPQRMHRRKDVKVVPGDFPPGHSILFHIRDRYGYPEITMVANSFASIKFYREWNLGRPTAPRIHQPTDLPSDFLEEDASNLAIVLKGFERDGTIEKVEKELNRFYERAGRISFDIRGGTAQLILLEANGKSIPATRLSDGTIRYLCLLAILLNPNPPPLVCLEEPELGLHPEMIPRVADLMKEASERMQLIVTTHSDILIDALSDTPESVVVCERGLEDGGTIFRRLDPEKLSIWMEDYRLGQLWRKGEIGGNRW